MAGFNFGKTFGPIAGGIIGGFGGGIPGAVAGYGAGGAGGGALDQLLNYLNPEAPQAMGQMPAQQPNPNLQAVRQQFNNLNMAPAPAANPNIDYLREQLRNPNVAYQAPAGVDFANTERLARQQFQNQTVPFLQQQFANRGATRSNALPNALAQAGTDLETRLAAMREGLAHQRGQANMQRLEALGGLEGNQQLFGQRQQQNELQRLLGLGGFENEQQRFGLQQQGLGLQQQGLNLQQQQQERAGNFLAPENFLPLLNLLGLDINRGEQANLAGLGEVLRGLIGVQANQRQGNPTDKQVKEAVPGLI